MNVLIQWDKSKARMIWGWASVLRASGFSVEILRDQNCFDVFDEFKPGVLIATECENTPSVRALSKCLYYHPNVKVIDQRSPQPGFDTITYKPGAFREELACDVTFVGTYRPKTAKLLDKFILPLINCGEFDVKLFGSEAWPVPQYLGPISDQDLPDLYASAGICLNISSGRIGERAYQILGLGGALVTYHESGLEELTLPRFSTKQGIFKRIRDEMGADPEYWKSLQRVVLDRHTYFHRIAELLRSVGLEQEGDQVESTYRLLGK